MANKNLTATLLLGGAMAAMLYAQSRRQRVYSFRGKIVAITGGSRGLGLVMARQLVSEGANVAILARDAYELMRARLDLVGRGHGQVLNVTCDVRDEASVKQAIDDVVRAFGGIDVLINNAGIIEVGPFEHMTREDFSDALNTHFWGPFNTITAALPVMKRQGGGRIANIASFGGKIAVPHMAPYSASKFALVGLSDALRGELAAHNIHVTTVVPSLMRTGSHVNALFKGQNQGEFTWFAISSSMPGLSVEAETAAQHIIDGIRRGDAQVVAMPPVRAAFVANELVPGIVASGLKLFNALLPRANPNKQAGDVAKPGSESRSAVPSALTSLQDQAAEKNNELDTRLRNELAVNRA